MRLTDTQLVLLNAALDRDEGAIVMPKSYNAGTAGKMALSLIKPKLAKEIPAVDGLPVFRKSDRDGPLALVITTTGREALISAGKTAPVAKPPKADKAKTKKAAVPKAGSKARTGTKQEAVIAMLTRKDGSTLDKICKATKWLPHTTRAFLSAALGKRLGLKIERIREDGVSTYRIVG